MTRTTCRPRFTIIALGTSSLGDRKRIQLNAGTAWHPVPGEYRVRGTVALTVSYGRAQLEGANGNLLKAPKQWEGEPQRIQLKLPLSRITSRPLESSRVVLAEPRGEPERRIGRNLKSTSLGRRRVTLVVPTGFPVQFAERRRVRRLAEAVAHRSSDARENAFTEHSVVAASNGTCELEDYPLAAHSFETFTGG